jgi:hypothetical protein
LNTASSSDDIAMPRSARIMTTSDAGASPPRSQARA